MHRRGSARRTPENNSSRFDHGKVAQFGKQGARSREEDGEEMVAHFRIGAMWLRVWESQLAECFEGLAGQLDAWLERHFTAVGAQLNSRMAELGAAWNEFPDSLAQDGKHRAAQCRRSLSRKSGPPASQR